MTHAPVPPDIHRLTDQLRTLRARDRLSRYAQWLVVFETLARVLGDLPALTMRGVIVSFHAEPADASCRCHGRQVRSKLTAVRTAEFVKLRLVERDVGRRGREALTTVWVSLAELVHDVAPMHPHAGFVIDFKAGILGCWHDWACVPCTQGAPCVVIDLRADAPLAMGEGPAVAGIGVLAGGLAGFELDLLNPPQPPARASAELAEELFRRMADLRAAVPCLLATDAHARDDDAA